MAKLGSITITDKESRYVCGAAFELSKRSKVNAIVRDFDPRLSEWEVEIQAESPYVVARGRGGSNPIQVFEFAYDVTQKALDVLSINGVTDLLIQRANETHIIWWPEDQDQVMRLVFTIPLGVSIHASVRIMNERGEEVLPPPPEPTRWHESFSYFRRSQLTDDVFDAYRNLYLAFENLLSSKIPRKRNEGEGDWLKRALQEISKVITLSRYAPPESNNPVTSIYTEQYKALRGTLFHAKHGESHLLPQNTRDRLNIESAFTRLTPLFLDLTRNLLGVQRAGGIMTFAGFDIATKDFEINPRILVSDDDTSIKRSDTIVSPAFRPVVALDTRFATELSKPGLKVVLGTAVVTRLTELTKIARMATFVGDIPIMMAMPEDELTFDGIDRLEVQMGARLKNLSQPRYDFLS